MIEPVWFMPECDTYDAHATVWSWKAMTLQRVCARCHLARAEHQREVVEHWSPSGPFLLGQPTVRRIGA